MAEHILSLCSAIVLTEENILNPAEDISTPILRKKDWQRFLLRNRSIQVVSDSK